MCLCVAAYTYHEETLLLKSSAPLCCFTFLLITLWVRISFARKVRLQNYPTGSRHRTPFFQPPEPAPRNISGDERTVRALGRGARPGSYCCFRDSARRPRHRDLLCSRNDCKTSPWVHPRLR